MKELELELYKDDIIIEQRQHWTCTLQRQHWTCTKTTFASLSIVYFVSKNANISC